MKKNHAFTLVELLVVVSIIVLLVALLLPSLSKARQVAKLAKCQANLRNIGVSLNNYMSQNNDITLEQDEVCLDVRLFGSGYVGDWTHNAEGLVFKDVFVDAGVTSVTPGTWVMQLVADGCAPAIRNRTHDNHMKKTEFLARGIFLCPNSIDNPYVIDIDKGIDATGAPKLAYMEPILGTDYYQRHGYGLTPYWTSKFNYLSGSSVPPRPELAGELDPKHFLQNGRYGGGGVNIRRRNKNMIPNHIIAADGGAFMGGCHMPYWPAYTTYADNNLYMRHSGAPNYLFGDGHVEWSDQYHKLRSLAYPQAAKHQEMWQHYNNDGSLTPNN